MSKREPIRLKTTCESPGSGESVAVEVDAFLVPNTGGLFATHRDEEAEEGSPGWVLTHVPSCRATHRTFNQRDAEYLARQQYDAAPEAWKLADLTECLAAMPRQLEAWCAMMQRATYCGVSPRLLKSYADFVRDNPYEELK
jgi:hypothetical protein